MTFTIGDLRKRSNNLASITAALEKANKKYSDSDDKFFKLERDKAGNGSAVLRFLPAHPDDELPWVTLYSHGFQGPSGKWYIENSRTSLGEEDPVGEYARSLWAKAVSEEDKQYARKLSRRTHYIFNVLVVSNPADPSLEGSVMPFKIGKKLFQKIMDKIKPTFEDEEPVNVFDPFDGANLKLRMRQVEGYPNYDQSVFEAPSPIADTDEKILEILNKMEPVGQYIAPSQFKSYEELNKKFNAVMNTNVPSMGTAEDTVRKMREEPVKEQKSVGKSVSTSVEEEDDTEEYFRKLASGEV